MSLGGSIALAAAALAATNPPSGAEGADDDPPPGDEMTKIIELETGETRLIEAFNEDAGKVRLLLILSPT